MIIALNFHADLLLLVIIIFDHIQYQVIFLLYNIYLHIILLKY